MSETIRPPAREIGGVPTVDDVRQGALDEYEACLRDGLITGDTLTAVRSRWVDWESALLAQRIFQSIHLSRWTPETRESLRKARREVEGAVENMRAERNRRDQ